MGLSQRRGQLSDLLKYGMHVVDAHDQIVGTILVVRKDSFMLRQELGMIQTVLLPAVAISGVYGGFLFLNLTPGEIAVIGRVVERRDRGHAPTEVRTRVARRLPLVPEPA